MKNCLHKIQVFFSSKASAACALVIVALMGWGSDAKAQNKPPVVSLTGPVAGASFTAPASISLTANASDPDGSIRSVAFYRGTTLLGTDNSAPYSYNWTNVAAGTYSITARATDNRNAVTTSAAVSVTVSAPNQAPVLNVTSPTNNQSFDAPANISFSLGATDSDGSIARVEIVEGANNVLATLTAAPYTFSWTNVSVGTKNIVVKAVDNRGAVTQRTLTLNVLAANALPTVSLTSPAPGTPFIAPAAIALSANAADADGNIASVAFYNGSTLLGTDTSSPYSFSWNNVAEGTYAISARATDNRGGIANSAPTQVTVGPARVEPSVAITAPLEGAEFKAPAQLTVSASAHGGAGTITKVDFYSGSNLILSDTSAPYTFTLNASSVGKYTVFARVTNNLGKTADSAPVGFSVVSNLTPAVQLTSPSNGADLVAPASLTLAAQATDADGTIASVSFFNGEVLLGTVGAAPYTFTWSNVPSGTYRLSARATDNGGAIGRSPVTIVNVKVDPNSTDPRVALTSPADATTVPASTLVDLIAEASASAGRSILGVSFISGDEVLAAIEEPPYRAEGFLFPPGRHEVVARATDSAGAISTSATHVITVQRSAVKPSISIVSPLPGSEYPVPAQVRLEAEAFGGAGSVAKVEFLMGRNLIYTATRAPYGVTLNAPNEADYSVFARVTNSLGETADSPEVPFYIVGTLSPKVELVSPMRGAFIPVGRQVNLEAAISATDRPVEYVEFFNGGRSIGVAKSYPYRLTLDSIRPGENRLTAVVWDSNWRAESQVLTVTGLINEDTPKPTVEIKAPISGQQYQGPATVTVRADPVPAVGRSISQVDFFADNELIASAFAEPFQINWSNVRFGTHVITAAVTDDWGMRANSPPVTINVSRDERPPTIQLFAPSIGKSFTAPGDIQLSAVASANTDRVVAKVDFYNGDALLGTVEAAPFVYRMRGVAAGEYLLKATVTDSAGVSASTIPRHVVVREAGSIGMISIISPTPGLPITIAEASDVEVRYRVTGAFVSNKPDVYLNGVLQGKFLGGITETQYYYLRNVPLGRNFLQVRAFDGDGIELTAELYFDVVPEPYDGVARIELSSPFNGEIRRLTSSTPTIEVDGRARDPHKIIKSVIFEATHQNGTKYLKEGIWNGDYLSATVSGGVPTPLPGEYVLVLKAFDANSTEVARSEGRRFKVVYGPQAYITSPPNYLEMQNGGKLTFNGYASPDNGDPIRKLDVYLDNQLLSSQSYSSEGAVFLSTEALNIPVGRKTIRFVATSRSGLAAEEFSFINVVDAADPDRLYLSSPKSGFQVAGNYQGGVEFTIADASRLWEGFSELGVDFLQVLPGFSYQQALPTGASSLNRIFSGLALGPWRARAFGITKDGVTRRSEWIDFSVYRRQIALQNPGPVAYPGTVRVFASADDCLGCIARVDFYKNGALIESSSSSPYSFDASRLGIGRHTVFARMVSVDPTRGYLESYPITFDVVANQLPSVVLTKPSNGEVFLPRSLIEISAEAVDADGWVQQVDFYAGPTHLGTVAAEPYSFSWIPTEIGEYVLTARVTDRFGAVAESGAVRVKVDGAGTDPNEPETVVYIHSDISGSPVAATNTNGNVLWKENYRAYGPRRLEQPTSAAQQQWFHGKEFDASTGLQYFGARFYDPLVGRFMGTDPVAFQESNLHSFNRYAYANNNPYRYIDPDGRAPIPAFVWAAFEVVAWLGARQAATVAVVEAGAVLATGAMSPPVALEGVAAKVTTAGVRAAGQADFQAARAGKLAENGGMCTYCSIRPATEVDHLRPVKSFADDAKAGKLTAEEAAKLANAGSNLKPACRLCNRGPGGKHAKELSSEPGPGKWVAPNGFRND